MASEWWDRIVPQLVAAVVASSVRTDALTMAAECWSRWHAAQAIVAAEGLVTKNSQGAARHPAAIAVQSKAREYRDWSRRFGLTALAELRVGKPVNETLNSTTRSPIDGTARDRRATVDATETLRLVRGQGWGSDVLAACSPVHRGQNDPRRRATPPAAIAASISNSAAIGMT